MLPIFNFEKAASLKTVRAMALGVLAIALTGIQSNQAHANEYSKWPSKPVTVVVPYPPGGATDISARIIARQMEAKYGVPFVINNKPGAGGNVGASSAVHAPGDGYTLLFGTQGLLTANPYLYKSLNYDIRKDFSPVGLTYDIPHLVVVNKNLPVKNMKELVDLAKSKPESLSYGSSGAGGGTHLFTEYFQMKAGIKFLHVPYQGSGPAKANLLGGQIDLMFDALSSIAPQVKNGDVRALAVTSIKRHPQFPEIPTISESFLEGFEATTWGAMLVPASTPPGLVEEITRKMNQVLKDPETIRLLGETGTLAIPASIQETNEKIRQEDLRWKEVITSLKISN